MFISWQNSLPYHITLDVQYTGETSSHFTLWAYPISRKGVLSPL
jgi:hypothetical protein